MKQWSWNWVLVGTILAWCVGFLGADRFFRGQIIHGALKLVTLGGFGAWYLLDALIWSYRLGQYTSK